MSNYFYSFAFVCLNARDDWALAEKHKRNNSNCYFCAIGKAIRGLADEENQ